MERLKWFFGFGNRSKIIEEQYHKKTKKYSVVGIFFTFLFNLIVPTLSIWGALKLPFEGVFIILKLICCVGIITAIQAPGDFMAIGAVALRHRAIMKEKNRIYGAMNDMPEGYEAEGTSNGYDLALGIIGITFGILSVFVFVGIFFWLASSK